MQGLTLIQKLAIFILPLIFAITVHEAAHGWMAKRLGDKTAQMLGRVTLNPFKHIDPVGTILVPLGLYLLTGFMFGWAKPVPVNWNNLHKPKRDMGLVALAGPGANLIMALIWSILVYVGALALEGFAWLGVPLVLMGVTGVLINTILMALNMMPVPPLDGYKILQGVLPADMAYQLRPLEQYGFLILIALIFFLPQLGFDLLGFLVWEPTVRVLGVLIG